LVKIRVIENLILSYILVTFDLDLDLDLWSWEVFSFRTRKPLVRSWCSLYSNYVSSWKSSTCNSSETLQDTYCSTI